MYIEPEKFEAIWAKLIAPNCGDIISVYQNTKQVLFRGIKNSPNFFRGMSRNDRKPKDSSEGVSKVFDSMLAANGMTALRSNSIFAISELDHTIDFGQPYIIFPIDGFDFTYTIEKDIVLDSWDKVIDLNKSAKLTRLFLSDKTVNPNGDEPSLIRNWISYRNEYTRGSMGQLNYAIQRMKTMFPDDPLTKDLSVETLLGQERFALEYRPQNSNLDYALTNKKEVYIKGQYYALNRMWFKNHIQKKLGFSIE